MSVQEASAKIELPTQAEIDELYSESLQSQLSPEEWARELQAWADSFDPNLPVLSDEAMSRDSIYD